MFFIVLSSSKSISIKIKLKVDFEKFLKSIMKSQTILFTLITLKQLVVVVFYYDILYFTLPHPSYYTILYYTILYYITILYYTILYYTSTELI